MNTASGFVWDGKKLLGGKSCLGFFGEGKKGDHLIRKEGITNGTCGIEENLAWEAEKTRGAGINAGEFNKE